MIPRQLSGLICHIVSRETWTAARAAGSLTSGSLETEGFLHFSTPEQVAASADRHYAGAGLLLALGVDPALLRSELRWDHVPSRGEDFPHLYGPLNLDAVVNVADLIETPEGYLLGPWRDI